MTETCAARQGDFDEVRWYKVPGSAVLLNGESVSSYWSQKGRFIVVPDSLTDAGSLVRHEMLHAILNNAGHPRAYFLNSCAGIVLCSESCAENSERWTAPTPFSVVPAQTLSVEAFPRIEPTEPDGDQWFTLRVVAHNTSQAPVLVDVMPWTSFGYTVQLIGKGGRSSSVSVGDSSMLYFAPNETKNWLFEWRIDSVFSKYTLQRGDSQFAGAFGQHQTAPLSWTIP